MTLEQLNSLNEDETAMLWYVINKVNPILSTVELDPPLFPSINKQRLMDRVSTAESLIKEEHRPIYDGLKFKMGMNQ
jgi:hypothetical protein